MNYTKEDSLENTVLEILMNLGRTEKGCKEYLGGLSSGGYGRVMINGTQYLVHRLVYKVLVHDIPDNIHVLHKCDNPSCIEPSHLFAGTDLDNQRDRVLKGRSKGGKPKIKLEVLIEFLRLVKLGCTGKSIAEQIGITPRHVCRLKRQYLKYSRPN